MDTNEMDLMLADLGQDVTIAGVTAKAILNATGIEVLAGEVTDVDADLIVFTTRTGAFPTIVVGETLGTVDDAGLFVTYLIRHLALAGDGDLVQIFCAVN